jgi:GTP-binding protein EngB required for normal cell division
LIVLSKIDKLSNSEYQKSLKFAKETFFWQDIIWVSSVKKTWLKELSQKLKSCLR